MLGLGIGMGVGNKAPLLPVYAFPSVSDIPPGALVLDSDGEVKEKRFVVELNGPDTLTFAPISADLKAIDWEFSMLFCDVNPSQSTYSRIVQFLAGSLANIILVASTTGGLEIYLRNDGATTVHSVTMGASYNNSKYHKITFGMAGGLFYAMSENEQKQTIAVPNWTGTGFSSVLISDTQISIRPIQISKIKQVSGSSVDCFQCNEQTGTAIANQCTPSRPATLSDAAAHVGALVPVSLLT